MLARELLNTAEFDGGTQNLSHEDVSIKSCIQDCRSKWHDEMEQSKDANLLLYLGFLEGNWYRGNLATSQDASFLLLSVNSRAVYRNIHTLNHAIPYDWLRGRWVILLYKYSTSALRRRDDEMNDRNRHCGYGDGGGESSRIAGMTYGGEGGMG